MDNLAGFFALVNFDELGAIELCNALLARGICVEAGLSERVLERGQ